MSFKPTQLSRASEQQVGPSLARRRDKHKIGRMPQGKPKVHARNFSWRWALSHEDSQRLYSLGICSTDEIAAAT